MKSVNLLPPARFAARRMRRRARGWAASLALYVVCLVVVAPIAAPTVSEAARETESKIVATEREIERAEAEMAELKPKLIAAQQALDAARSVSEHPDWSVVLMMMAALREDEVVLESCDLAETRPAAPAKPAASKGATPAQPVQADGAVVTASGYARSPVGVTGYALRLEKAGVFRDVQIAETGPREYRGAAMTWFRIKCRVETGGHVEPAKAGKGVGKR